jgi:hypothetical protein
VDNSTVWLILILFVLAWGAPLALIVHYRVSTVRRRYDEIRDALLDRNDLAESPARHYLKLFTRKDPGKNATADELEAAIYAHFLQFHSWTRYALALVLLASFSGGAFYFVWGWTTQTFTGTSPFGPIKHVLPMEAVFALTGAYVWSLYELSDRARRRDLTPDELFDVSIRYLFALPIGYVGALLSVDSVDAGFAFAASALPLRDIRRFVRKRALEKMNVVDAKVEPTRAGYLTEVVDGLGPDTLARLEEIGIVTFTDLAYADPIQIMVKAGFSLRHIIQWMDHAMLAIYAFDYKKKLAENGITCSLDAKEFYETHFENKATDKCPAVAALEQRMSVPAVLLCEIFSRVAIDPQVLFLGKMWYTGYPGERVQSPPCKFH